MTVDEVVVNKNEAMDGTVVLGMSFWGRREVRCGRNEMRIGERRVMLRKTKWEV